MFRKKREKEIIVPRSMILEDTNPNGLAAKLNDKLDELYRNGFELVSINGYNLEFIQTGPYQQIARYSTLIIYRKRESE